MDTNFQFLKVDLHQLAYTAFNRHDPRQPIILLHDLTSTIAFWHKGEPYNQYGPCYALSLPGHYPAIWPQKFQEDQFSAKELGRLVGEAIKQLSPDRPVTVVGHGVGGLAALAAAIQHPAKINRLIVVSGFVSGQRGGRFGRLEKLAQRNASRYFFPLAFLYRYHPALFRANVALMVSDRQAVRTHPDLESLLSLVYPYTQRLNIRAIWHYFHMLPATDMVYRLPRIAAATLTISGEKDPIVPSEQSQMIASRIPNSHSMIIPGVGHLPMFERPQVYQQLIHDWLRR